VRDVLRGGLLATVVWIAAACNGVLRFDETPLDASASETVVDVPSGDDAGDASDGAVALCAEPTACGWQIIKCEDDTCEFHCQPGHACTNAVCGAGCLAECKENSSCSITTGDSGRGECSAGASCTFTVGIGGTATCDADSNCRLQCSGPCLLTCRTGATCQLRCSDQPEAQSVTGRATCP
jgi:hypothetical protein